MNTTDLKKNSKEELIIYIEKLSRDMTQVQQENLELRRECQYQRDYITKLEKENDNLNTCICDLLHRMDRTNN